MNPVISKIQQDLGPLRKEGDRFIGVFNKDYSKWVLLTYKEIGASITTGVLLAVTIRLAQALLH